MSGGNGRAIRTYGHDIEVEWIPEEASDPLVEDFSEVRLLPNGWVECRSEKEDGARTNPFPAERVNEIMVYDEDVKDRSATW